MCYRYMVIRDTVVYDEEHHPLAHIPMDTVYLSHNEYRKRDLPTDVSGTYAFRRYAHDYQCTTDWTESPGRLYLTVLNPFDAGKLALQLFLVFLVYQGARNAEHAVHALGKMHDFLLCLQHSNLWRLYHAATDEMQRGGQFCLSFAFRQQPANEPLHLWDETDEQGGVQYVETGVEHGQHHRYPRRLPRRRGIVSHKVAHPVDKGIEHGHHPHHSKHIEQQVNAALRASVPAPNAARLAVAVVPMFSPITKAMPI